jgi:subtilisin family serine protease
MRRMIAVLVFGLVASGCGNGRSGGPNDPVVTGTAGQEQVKVGTTTVAAKPYARKEGTGAGTVTLTLRAGVNLVGLRYDQVDDDYDVEGVASLARSGVNFFHVAAGESESGETVLHVLVVPKDGTCQVAVQTAHTRDKWTLMLFHKDALGDAKTEIKEPPGVYEEPGEDPLYPYQWYLNNSGQSDHVVFDAVAGEDIDVEPVWEQGLFGSGVTVAVVDQGVEINHPDLVGNIDITRCWNYAARSLDTTPVDPGNAHGTAVAGIIAASGWNGIGGRGVAPKAKLVSFNMLESQGIVPWSLALDSLVRDLEHIDIYNNSWGHVAGMLQPNPPMKSSLYFQFANQLAYGVESGRDGKGAIYVKSAGNERVNYSEDTSAWSAYWNANFSPEQVERYMIVVGASDADGTYSWYSTPGANLLVNAPGGDTQPAYLKAAHHMIATTDLTGRHAGYDYRDENMIDYHFDAKGNENYDYTDRMNGTSSAGPVVSGVVALMLEANPALTWRDVRYILATTATKNGSGYIPNTAGHLFSNDYGFGRVNAAAAIEAAKGWTPLGEEQSLKLGGAGGDAHSEGSYAVYEQHFDVSGSVAVEYVNVTFTVAAVSEEAAAPLPKSNTLNVVLVSPSGTESVLIDAPNGLEDDAEMMNMRVGSNAFLDEESAGIWTLRIKEVEDPYHPKEAEDLRTFRAENLTLEIYGRL